MKTSFLIKLFLQKSLFQCGQTHVLRNSMSMCITWKLTLSKNIKLQFTYIICFHQEPELSHRIKFSQEFAAHNDLVHHAVAQMKLHDLLDLKINIQFKCFSQVM